MQIRRAADRGRSHWGCLDTHHSFSFADYNDSRFTGFGHLRVINEDRVAASRGFGIHRHRDMEIISYAVSGELAHRDNTGSGGVIRHGEVQTMSAGRGVAHSEMNASDTEPVHFLQIWMLPKEAGTSPSYGQKHFDLAERGLKLIVSGDGREDSLLIGQDVDLYRVLLSEGEKAVHTQKRRRAWVQIIHGELVVEGALLQPGDGLALMDSEQLTLGARDEVEALLFDLL